jgi:hypothetical protein
MTVADLDLIIRDGAMVVTTIVVPFAIWAYHARTGVQITDQQRSAVNAALTTAAGIIQTDLDRGTLKAADISTAHPVVVQAAADALARVPDSAAAQGTTLISAAEIIVGRVSTKPATPVIVIPAPVPPIQRA